MQKKKGTAAFRLWSTRRGPTTDVDPAPPAPARFELDRCVLVEVGDDALLRVSGRWSPATPLRVQAFTSGGGGRVVAPLPPGPAVDADGLWAAAFPVDREDHGTLALVTPVAGTVPLPAPDRVAAKPAPAAPVAPAEPVAAPDELAEAQALVHQLRRRCELSERGLSEVRDKLVTAWGEAAELRDLLDMREAAHEAARQRERDAVGLVEELEGRKRDNVAELEALRREVEDHCSRLQNELDARTRGESEARDALEAATAQAAALRSGAEDALRQFEGARAKAEALDSELADARAAADEAAQAANAAAEALSAERSRSAEAERQASAHAQSLADAQAELSELSATVERLTAELAAERATAAVASAELESARDQLTASEARVEQLEQKADAGLEALEEAHLEVQRLREALGAAEAGSKTARSEVAELQRDLDAAREQADELQARTDEAVASLERTNAELRSLREHAEESAARADVATAKAEEAAAERDEARSAADSARRQLNDMQAASEQLAQSERSLREQLQTLTQPVAGGETVRRGGLKRTKVAAHAYAEALRKLEAEQAERARLAARVAELEDAASATPAREEIERLATQVAAADERVEAARAAAADATTALERERALREHLAQVSAQARAEASHWADLVASLEHELAKRRSENSEVPASPADDEVSVLRGQLADSETTIARLALSEQSLRQELDSLTRTDLGEQRHGIGFGRSKVSTRAHRETVAKLEHERAERARFEAEAAQLANRLHELEHDLAGKEPTPAQAAIEADLRHLLTTTQRELAEARLALDEQHSRYASVASQVPVDGERTAPQCEAGAPWTAIDEDLLQRIALAKARTSQD